MQSPTQNQEATSSSKDRPSTDVSPTTALPSVSGDQPLAKRSSPTVHVKYELFPFHKEVIKTLSVCGSMLVFGSGNENDLVKVVSFSATENHINYRQVQVHKLMSNRQNFIEWSPNGQYLALGWDKVTVWQYQGGMFSRFKEHPDVLYEVTAFTWCPNSLKYAVAGINTSLSIFVRSLESDEKIKELKNEVKVLGLVWDPFDKHLASLMSNNEVVVYKCASWERSQTINLNLNPQKPLSSVAKREDRKIDWSPDFRYLLVPALDDRTVPLVVALNRNNNFSARCVFTGPFSSINCVKFSPILYLYNNTEPINVFAMGDNDGSISVWGIGERFYSKQPFFLLKSHKDENELIEDIEWSDDGRVLFASTFKRYLVTMLIDEGSFGRRLNNEEKRAHLENVYGSMRSFASTQNEFKIYKFGEVRNERATVEDTYAKKLLAEENKISHQEPQEFVFTEQKTIKDGGKKRIIPSVLVKKDEAQAAKSRVEAIINDTTSQPQPTTASNKQQKQASLMIEEKPPVQVLEVRSTVTVQPKPDPRPSQSSELSSAAKPAFKVTVEQKLMLPVLDTSPTTYLIDPTRSVEIEYKMAPQNESTLKVYIVSNELREILASISISGRVNHLCMHRETLLIYSSEGYLYSFGLMGQATELPLFLGRIHLFRVNSSGDILTISVTCDLKVFSVSRNKLYFITNIFELVAANIQDKESRQINKVIDAVELGEDRSVTIQFTNKKVFLWGEQVAAWCLVDTTYYQLDRLEPTGNNFLNKGLLNPREEQANRQFMEGLLAPPNLTPAHKLEYNLIFYRKHKPDLKSYTHALLEYIKELARQRMDNRLRAVLHNHFIDSSKEQFIREPSRALTEQLLAIRSDIIEEFHRLYNPLPQ